MMGDGLYEPLGRDAGAGRPSGSMGRAAAVAGLAVALLAGVAGWAWWRWPPRPAPAATLAVVPMPPPPPAPPLEKAAPADPAVKVIRPDGAPAFPGTFIPVPQADPNALAAAPDARLVEKSRYGLLPRRGPDGATPAKIYARPATALPAGAPRVALFVGGMGLDPALTAAAAQALPPAVTLGFAPYGGDLAGQVERARALGHEAVLQVPMESFDPPDTAAAMPRLLTVGSSPRDTLDDLHWQMARFVGYAGLANFMGGKFTADGAAFTPVLKDVAERGLFFLDDGSAPRNLATSLGPPLGLPVAKADIVIDALGEPDTVDAALRKLEKLAQSKGSAIGSTTGLPTTVDHVAAFAAGLAAHGIALVPVSALATTSSSRTDR